MMKFIMPLIFMIPLCFCVNYWMILLLFMFLSFMFLVNISFSSLFVNLSYFYGIDLLSFTLILLSFWICSLMILASEKVFKMNNYYGLFLFLNLIIIEIVIGL